MPIIGVKKTVLEGALGESISEEALDVLCFDYGLELDEVTSERAQLTREQGPAARGLEEASDETIFRIEIPANRYDLLCSEGLVRALQIFRGLAEAPRYELSKPLQRLVIDQATNGIRPFAVAAVLRGLTLDQDRYQSLIDLQEKLHQNLCRKRTLVAIGTHDLDSLQGPFRYTALPPQDISFVPLNQTKEFRADHLLQHYKTDSHLKQYLHIVEDSPVLPVILDAANHVLSLPPIINGDHSRISPQTRNLFIECTATDLHKASVVLDTIVTMFSQYCDKPFSVEAVEIENADGTVAQYPVLATRNEVVPLATINTLAGISLRAKEAARLLTRMSLQSSPVGGSEAVEVVIPPTRHDVLHAVDIVEDAAIAFGYNAIPKLLPRTSCIGSMFKLNKLTDLLRGEIAAAGFTEALTFSLCSEEDVSRKFRLPDGAQLAVHISNPKTSEFQVGRTMLLPGMLKTLHASKKMPLPLKLFEIQDVILKDQDAEVGARNERRFCAVYCGKTAGFEAVHGLLDRLMQLLEVPFSQRGQPLGYSLERGGHPSFFPGRCGKVVARGSEIGHIGVLHPEVLAAFDLSLPCAALEINLQAILQ